MTENTTPGIADLTSESTPADVLDAGLTLVRETLDALYQAGLLSGYAAVLEPHPEVSPECGAMIVSCCAGHAAQSLHPRIVDASNSPELAAIAEAQMLADVVGMFRQAVPSPRQSLREMQEANPSGKGEETPGAGPAEFTQAAYDAWLERGRVTGKWDDDDADNGTGMYL